jgi:hypothetical protein
LGGVWAVGRARDRSGNPAGATNGSDEELERIARFFRVCPKKCARIFFEITTRPEIRGVRGFAEAGEGGS